MTPLGECYKQLNSSVGDFGAATLQADDAGHRRAAARATAYVATDQALRGLEVARDRLAGLIKGELEAAAFGDRSISQVGPQILGCQLIIHRAGQLASAAS